jgi:hypothetical protein
MAKLKIVDGPRAGGDYHTPGGYREIGYVGEILIPYVPKNSVTTKIALYTRKDTPHSRGKKKPTHDGELHYVKDIK